MTGARTTRTTDEDEDKDEDEDGDEDEDDDAWQPLTPASSHVQVTILLL